MFNKQGIKIFYLKFWTENQGLDSGSEVCHIHRHLPKAFSSPPCSSPLNKTKTVRVFQDWLLSKQVIVHSRWEKGRGRGREEKKKKKKKKEKENTLTPAQPPQGWWFKAPLSPTSSYLLNNFWTLRGNTLVLSQRLGGSNCYTGKLSGPKPHRYPWITAAESGTDGHIHKMRGWLCTSEP